MVCKVHHFWLHGRAFRHQNKRETAIHIFLGMTVDSSKWDKLQGDSEPEEDFASFLRGFMPRVEDWCNDFDGYGV